MKSLICCRSFRSNTAAINPIQQVGAFKLMVIICFVDGAQMIFASATCPVDLTDLVAEIVDDQHILYVTSRHLHKIMPNVEQKFIRVRENEKVQKLFEELSEINLNKKRVLVFCKVSVMLITFTLIVSRTIIRRSMFQKSSVGSMDFQVCWFQSPMIHLTSWRTRKCTFWSARIWEAGSAWNCLCN